MLVRDKSVRAVGTVGSRATVLYVAAFGRHGLRRRSAVGTSCTGTALHELRSRDEQMLLLENERRSTQVFDAARAIACATERRADGLGVELSGA